MTRLSDTQRAYVAGILDGEGSFCFYRTKSQDPSYEFRYVPVVSVEMGDSRVIYRIAEVFGRPVKSRKRGNNRRTYTVSFQSDHIKNLLYQVSDLLIVKKEQAELMSLWFEVFGFNTKSLNFAGQRLDLQKMFYDCCRNLNTGKGGELRETLSNEAILSQAVEEIRLKVQRLEDEAKEITKNRVLDIIKVSGRISRSDIYRVTHCRNVFELDIILSSIVDVRSELEGRTRFYFYAGNASTSAADRDICPDHDIVRTAQRCAEA